MRPSTGTSTYSRDAATARPRPAAQPAAPPGCGPGRRGAATNVRIIRPSTGASTYSRDTTTARILPDASHDVLAVGAARAHDVAAARPTPNPAAAASRTH